MAMGRRMMRPDTRGPQIRVNHRIRVPEVRVVMDDGGMMGVMPTHEALRVAQERGLDLVEVNPKASPPVCKILDFGKFKYEEKKRQREAKRKQTVVEVKEIKLRPKTDDHDLNVKLRALRKFLEAGNKVKISVRFRGREITHPERAERQLEWMMSKSEDIANVEQRRTMEARAMSLILGPKPQVLQRLASEKARQRAEKRKAERLAAKEAAKNNATPVDLLNEDADEEEDEDEDDLSEDSDAELSDDDEDDSEADDEEDEDDED